MAIADDPVWPLASGLLDCLCEALGETVRGPVCSCCVYPGTAVPADDCCDCTLTDGTPAQGQAWVHVGRSWRAAARFPDQDFAAANGCGQGSWAVELVMGTHRCAATLDDDGTAPSCERIEGDARALASDMAAMRQVIGCCLPGLLDDAGGGRYTVGEIEQITPEGACMGARATVTVEVADCCP